MYYNEGEYLFHTQAALTNTGKTYILLTFVTWLQIYHIGESSPIHRLAYVRVPFPLPEIVMTLTQKKIAILIVGSTYLLPIVLLFASR